MAKIVVFGAGGFIGQNLVRSLASNPTNNIIAFDRFSDFSTHADNPFAEFKNVDIVVGNFFNRDDIASTLVGADYVFHFISLTNPIASSKDPFIDIDTNVRGSIELFELCAENEVKKIIFPSSGGTVYGDIDSDLIGEDTVPAPRSPYGIGKLTIEHYLRYFKFTRDLDYVIYRIANPYGHGQNIFGKQGVIPIFMHKFLTHQPIAIYGDGSMVRDYLYIDDLIAMIVRTYDKNNKHAVYNLGSGNGYTVNEVVEAIEQCTKQTSKQEHLETPSAFVQRSVLNIRRFEEEFGKQSFTPLTEGIARTWEYVKQFK